VAVAECQIENPNRFGFFFPKKLISTDFWARSLKIAWARGKG
jgi:hypothetical protein